MVSCDVAVTIVATVVVVAEMVIVLLLLHQWWCCCHRVGVDNVLFIEAYTFIKSSLSSSGISQYIACGLFMGGGGLAPNHFLFAINPVGFCV